MKDPLGQRGYVTYRVRYDENVARALYGDEAVDEALRNVSGARGWCVRIPDAVECGARGARTPRPLTTTHGRVRHG